MDDHDDENLQSIEPDYFSDLTNDPFLKAILSDRFNEARRCIKAEANLAAVIIMASLLEGCLVTLVIGNRARANRCKTSPKDGKGKPKPFNDWNLNSLIEVACECGWIKKHSKDFSHSLRDYRNLVHPWLQYRNKISLDKSLVEICWTVTHVTVQDIISVQTENKKLRNEYYDFREELRRFLLKTTNEINKCKRCSTVRPKITQLNSEIQRKRSISGLYKLKSTIRSISESLAECDKCSHIAMGLSEYEYNIEMKYRTSGNVKRGYE